MHQISMRSCRAKYVHTAESNFRLCAGGKDVRAPVRFVASSLVELKTPGPVRRIGISPWESDFWTKGLNCS